MSKKKNRKKSKLRRTIHRLFFSTEFGPGLLLVVLICVGSFAFSAYTGLWLIFGMFAIGSVLLIGGFVGVAKLQRWINRGRPVPEADGFEDADDWTPPCYEPSRDPDPYYERTVSDGFSDSDRGKSTGMLGHFN